MQLRTKALLLAGLASGTVLAQSEAGPRSYRFTVDEHTANGRGAVVNRKRIAGEALRRNVTPANADGDTGSFQPPEKRAFMEGFRYPHDLADML